MKVLACLATSLDGQIARPDHPEKRFSSRQDLERLFAVRDLADAVLVGGGTFRAYNKPHRGLKKRDFLHAIVTHTVNLPPQAPLFDHPELPVVIYTPHPSPERFPDHLHWVPQTSPAAILADLAGRGVETLLIEGGGHMVTLFAPFIDTFYLTVCPVLLGGQTGLTHGPVLPSAWFCLNGVEQVGDELFLIYNRRLVLDNE
jgi:riboflavin biosynthesis pyrimidine reductase